MGDDKAITLGVSVLIELPPYEVLSQTVEIHPGTLEVAEDVFSFSGVDPVHRWQLEWIVRAVLYVERASVAKDQANAGFVCSKG